jgi:hypothetical protein
MSIKCVHSTGMTEVRFVILVSRLRLVLESSHEDYAVIWGDSFVQSWVMEGKTLGATNRHDYTLGQSPCAVGANSIRLCEP